MSSVFKICQKCDSAYTGLVCLNCGSFVKDELEEISVQQNSDFGFLAAAINEKNSKLKEVEILSDKRRGRFALPFLLSLILLSIGAFAYWIFIYSTPDYVSPYVLSAVDVRRGDVQNEVIEISDAKEKVIPLDIGHKEGSFDRYNFAQFAPTDIAFMVSAFDISDVLSKYFKDLDIIKNIKSEFDLSDNDIDVFFSKEFAIYIPGDDFSRWGFAIYTADKSFADSKVEMLSKNREKSKFIFKDYFADVVEVKQAGKDISKNEDDEKKTPESEYFLLVSNSKEYLDQMKESSEGNLTNLSADIKYSRIRADLPKVGQVLIYRKVGAVVWDLFVEWVSSKYDYIGLDKILMAIDAPGIIFFSNNSKLKITTADIM